MDVDPDDAVALVALDAEFEPDSTFRLGVYRTQPLGVVADPGLFGGAVPEARVTITDQRGLALPFPYGATADQPTAVRLVPGEAYVLTVDVPDLPRATVAFRMPLPVAGFSATAGPMTSAGREVVVRFQDPPGEGDQYALSVRSRIGGAGERERVFTTSDPSIRDESFWETIQNGAGRRGYYAALFSDALFDGMTHEIRLTVLPQNAGSAQDESVQVAELRVVNRAYVDRARVGNTFDSPNPFAETAAPPSNVEGGVGLVGAFVRQRVTL